MSASTVRQKVRQLAIGIFAVMSLSVSSVAACMCSHHEQSKRDEVRSCHGGAKTSQHHSTKPSERPSVRDSCNCVSPSIDRSVKAEGFKLKKHPLAVLTAAGVRQRGFYSPTPETSVDGPHIPGTRRSDRPPSSRGPPLS